MYKIDINEILSAPQSFNEVVEEMPTDGLLYEVVAIARHFAGVLRSNLNYVLAAMFTCLGSLLGRRVVSSFNAYKNKAALYTMLLGDSGDSKSPTMDFVIDYINKVDHKNDMEFEKRYDADIMAEKKIPAVFDKQMIAENCTIEKLYSILYATKTNSATGVLLHLDEATTFFTPGAALKSKTGAHVPHIMTMFSKPRLQVDRQYLGKPLSIENPMLSILAGTQYDNLGGIFNGFQGCGFSARWLFCLPCRAASKEYKNDTHVRFWEECQERAIELSNLTLNFANSSQVDEMQDAFTDCNVKMKKLDSEKASYVIKQNYYLHRLAIIVHCVNSLIDGNSPSEIITEEELDYAFRLCMHFIKTGAISLGMMENQNVLSLSGKRILQELHRRWPITNFTALSEATGGKLDRAYASKCIHNKI